MNDMLEIIRDATGRIFQDHCTHDVRERAEAGEWPERLWNDIVKAGITRALLSEENDGAGLSFEDAGAVMRLAGYHAVPIPLVETMVAARLLADAGLNVPDGPLSLAPCVPGRELTAERNGSDWKIHGECNRVPWGRMVAGFLAPVRRKDALELVFLHPDDTHVTHGTNLAFEPRDTVRLDAVSVADNAFLPWRAEGVTPYALGALLRVQQIAGAAQRALDSSTQYAGERVQFGRPIGKFQAIQQQLAAMAGEVAAANASADSAAAAWGTDKAGFLVASAKARCGEAASQTASIAHQVHGAMGFTREHSLHFSTRRLWSWRDEFGHDVFWQRELGRQVLDLGADGLWPYLVREPETSGEGHQP